MIPLYCSENLCEKFVIRRREFWNLLLVGCAGDTSLLMVLEGCFRGGRGATWSQLYPDVCRKVKDMGTLFARSE